MNFEVAVQKAQTLGVEMAKLGFHLEDNPYSHLNPKLESSWADGYCKYCAMVGLAQLAVQEQGEAARPAPSRKRARAREEKRKELYAVG